MRAGCVVLRCSADVELSPEAGDEATFAVSSRGRFVLLCRHGSAHTAHLTTTRIAGSEEEEEEEEVGSRMFVTSYKVAFAQKIAMSLLLKKPDFLFCV